MEDVKINCPSPSLPNRFSTGISQSTKANSAMGAVRNPILCSFLLIEKPGVSLSTMNALMPAAPFDGSRLAKTITISATWALLINVFDPLIT